MTALRPPVIETERLRLVVLLADEVEALVHRDGERAGRSCGVVFPPGWPGDADARQGLSWHLRHLRADAGHTPWRIRVIAERVTDAVVGSVNLKGPPDTLGDVEIGWGLLEHCRRRGYAFEAAIAVVQ